MMFKRKRKAEPKTGCGCLPAAYDDGYQCECGDAHVDTCQGCAR